MVQQIKAKAMLITHSTDSHYGGWYRCNQCNDMFGPMIHFDDWDFFYCIPRKCPNCGIDFSNGMKEI